MAIGNGELMHECFQKHSRMGSVNKTEIRQRQRKKVRKEA